MSDDIRKMRTLMQRLETAITRIEDVADSVSAPPRDPSAATPVPPLATTEPSEKTAELEQREAPAVQEFDALQTEHLDKFIALSQEVGELVAEQATSVKAGFAAQRKIIAIASKSTKPDQSSSEYEQFLGPLQAALAAVGAIKDKNRPSPLFNHLSAVADGIGALGWVAVEPAPAPYVGEMKDSAQFYANRVIKDNKESNPKHVEWVRSYTSLLTELQKYVKANHTTGLSWNPKGSDLKTTLASATSTSAPTAPAPSAGGPPPPP